MRHTGRLRLRASRLPTHAPSPKSRRHAICVVSSAARRFVDYGACAAFEVFGVIPAVID
ncbi:MAG: hypothetical protein ACSLE9_16635 [Burkholderiaceae bacterium]